MGWNCPTCGVQGFAKGFIMESFSALVPFVPFVPARYCKGAMQVPGCAPRFSVSMSFSAAAGSEVNFTPRPRAAPLVTLVALFAVSGAPAFF